jgi:hypothetical protein
MALHDLILKARVNMALIRDPRVSALDIGVICAEGDVTLEGDVDTEQERAAAEEIAHQVEGVVDVHNEITCGLGKQEDTAELVTLRLLEKLDEEWRALPDQLALTQADYLRWALWLVYKFRIPAPAGEERPLQLEADATEQALVKIAGYVGIPKALVALEMLRQAEMIAQNPRRNAPALENISLSSTPKKGGDNPE